MLPALPVPSSHQHAMELAWLSRVPVPARTPLDKPRGTEAFPMPTPPWLSAGVLQGVGGTGGRSRGDDRIRSSGFVRNSFGAGSWAVYHPL